MAEDNADLGRPRPGGSINSVGSGASIVVPVVDVVARLMLVSVESWHGFPPRFRLVPRGPVGVIGSGFVSMTCIGDGVTAQGAKSDSDTSLREPEDVSSPVRGSPEA